MGLIKGIELEFHLRSFSVGFFLSFYDDPSMIGVGFGFFGITINRPQYFKNGLISISIG